MPHLVKIAPGVTYPHIAKLPPNFFYFFLCTQNLYTDLELRPLNRFLGVRTQYFHNFTLKRLVYIAASKICLRRIQILFILLNQHFISYFSEIFIQINYFF